MQRVPHHIHAGQTHDLALFQPDLVHTVIVLSGDLLERDSMCTVLTVQCLGTVSHQPAQSWRKRFDAVQRWRL